MYHIADLNDIISTQQLYNLRKFIKNMKWNYKIPGGFLTNSPQRKVNTFGDGKFIDDNGNLKGHGWSDTFWTSKQTQNNVSLQTKTAELPASLISIIPKLRTYLRKLQPNNTINLHSFNIAVCNNYTDPYMNIAPHTDDNFWYPKEVNNRPLFISLSFYLDGTPIKDEYYSRFQIKINDKWIDIKLNDNSVLFMNSDIYHRVLKHKKNTYKYFKPRINITLRSTYPININPLLHNICIANHTRYYRNPYCIISDNSIDKSKINDLLDKYNIFCKNNQYDFIFHKYLKNHNNKAFFINLYYKLCYQNNIIPYKNIKNNIVSESLMYVCYYLISL